ncbi:hypothetical protein [Haliscomenobacter sp.]|uniref:hypothetical protein n=1 Tax=Haliscomenobacter sp. TaxID=2717303 RepID=UPI003BACA85B
MRTIAQIDTDIARIEALMILGSKREIAKLSKIRELCFSAKSVINDAKADFLAKQLEDTTTKFSKYLGYKKEVAKIEYADYRKLKQKELEKEFKPDVLVHQIKFLNYILGDVELVDQDLLTSLKGVSATGKHAAKVNPV